MEVAASRYGTHQRNSPHSDRGGGRDEYVVVVVVRGKSNVRDFHHPSLHASSSYASIMARGVISVLDHTSYSSLSLCVQCISRLPPLMANDGGGGRERISHILQADRDGHSPISPLPLAYLVSSSSYACPGPKDGCVRHGREGKSAREIRRAGCIKKALNSREDRQWLTNAPVVLLESIVAFPPLLLPLLFFEKVVVPFPKTFKDNATITQEGISPNSFLVPTIVSRCRISRVVYSNMKPTFTNNNCFKLFYRIKS